MHLKKGMTAFCGHNAVLWVATVLGRVKAGTDLTDKWSFPGRRRLRSNIAPQHELSDCTHTALSRVFVNWYNRPPVLRIHNTKENRRRVRSANVCKDLHAAQVQSVTLLLCIPMGLSSNLGTETSYNDSGFSMVSLSASKQTPRSEPRPLPSTFFRNHCSLTIQP